MLLPDDLLHAVDVGREGRDNNAVALRLAEQTVQALGHHPLGGRVAGALRVGALSQQREHALVADPRKGGKVDGLAADGRAVDFEVARVHQRAAGRLNGKRHRVGNGMVDMDEQNIHAAQRDGAARVHHVELRLVHQAVLTQLVFHQAERQRRAVDGHVDL